MQSQTRDNWTSGDAYQRFMGRWSPRLAELFLPWLGVPPGAAWLDVGCGTGALSQTILALAAPSRLLGVDPSGAFVEFARQSISDPKAEFKVGNAQDLPAEDASFHVAVSGLVLNFVPDPAAALAEMRRVLRPGGTLGAYVWDYADGMRMLRIFWDAAIALDASAVALDEGVRFSLCHPDRLAELFNAAGPRKALPSAVARRPKADEAIPNVQTRALEITMEFKDFDDYWQPFTGVQGPAPGYLAKLPPEKQEALREEVRGRLPANADGSIHLGARAWAVKGNK